jgi:hypothetical protein
MTGTDPTNRTYKSIFDVWAKTNTTSVIVPDKNLKEQIS